MEPSIPPEPESGVTPANFDDLVATFGDGAYFLLAFQAQHAARVEPQREKITEIEADPKHPLAPSLPIRRACLAGAVSCRVAMRTWKPARARRAPRVRPRPMVTARPRERREASRRGSTRAGPDDPDPPQPGDSIVGRLCACGCGRSLEGKRRDARVFDNTCQQRLGRRKKAEVGALNDEPSADQRWARTLPLAGDIATVEAALADGSISLLAGGRLLSLLVRARLKQLRGPSYRLTTLDGIPYGDCTHPVVSCDPDGDAICVHCGQLAGRVSYRLNGYDRARELMAQHDLLGSTGTVVIG
jgi:hypothetical protein